MASKPFAIVEIEGAGDGFSSARFPTSRKPVHVVTFSYKPEEGKTRGDLRHLFRVKTDLPGEGPWKSRRPCTSTLTSNEHSLG